MLRNKAYLMMLVVLLVCGAAQLSYAGTINGSIGFTGVYTQNGGTSGQLNTATTMTIDTVAVNVATGDLAGAGAPLSFASPIGVNGNAPSLVGNQLWSVTVGTDTYTFVVGTESQTLTSTTQVNLAGTGTMFKNGSNGTDGQWQLGFGVSGASFTWQATSSATPVPEPASMMLFGSGLLSLGGLVRRKLGR